MVRRFSLAWLLAGLFSLLNAFDSQWHVHTSMSDVRDIDCNGGRVFAATAGGLLVIDAATGESQSYSISEGLGGTSVACVAADRASGKVYLALDNGCLSVYDQGTFRTYTDFKSQIKTGFKFNKLLVHKGVLVIASTQGVSFFADGPGAMVGPSFDKFGDENNPFLNRAQEVRDLTIRNDTLYLLTRFFWAKTSINWTLPLLDHNPLLKIGSPKIWVTNGQAGDFCYAVDGDTVGYTTFVVTAAGVLGLLDRDTYLDAAGVTSGLGQDSLRSWVHACGTADTSFYANPDNARIAYTCLALDQNGRRYAGTGGQGVVRLTDSTSFWNGDEQAFSFLGTLKTDADGNVYATNVLYPGAFHYNSFSSLGILKFDGESWKYVFYGAPGANFPGVCDITVDSRERLVASYSAWNTAEGGMDHGFLFFDNPHFKSDTVIGAVSVGPTAWTHPHRIGSLDFSPAAPLGSYNGSQVVSTGETYTPTALCFDNIGNFYFSQSNLAKLADGNFIWLNFVPGIGEARGSIRAFKDRTYRGSTQAGGSIFNNYNYSPSGGQGGFKDMGIVEYSPSFIQKDGHYNSIAVDKAGNIWAVGQSLEKINVFGRRADLSTADTFIYDNGDGITQYLYQSGEGTAECRRGLDAHLSNKIVKKVKTDRFGDIWVATTAGLFYYADGGPVHCYWNSDCRRRYCDTLTAFGNVGGLWRYFLPDISINDFDFDTLDNVWIATDNDGLKMLYGNTAKYFTQDSCKGQGDRTAIRYDSYNSFSGLISDRVLSVAVQKKTGKVFIGFENGLQEFESGIREADKVEDGYVYPVLLRPPGEEIFLNTKANGSSILIYTLSGKLVYHVTLPENRSACLWNTRNGDNRRVSSGVYLYRFTAPDKTAKTGKFAIVR